MNKFLKYLCVFGMAMLPIVELRGAIPFGHGIDGLMLFGQNINGLGLPLIPVLLVSILGNMVPVPFIILFIRPIFNWMKKKSRWMAKIVNRLEARAKNKHEMIVKYQMLGLFILVAIPLPGTGAWTGALVAALFDLRLKNAVPVILAGVTAAGVITSIILFGVSALV